jgi:micrococcal nuclease
VDWNTEATLRKEVKMETTLYHYKALVTEVYDGDTCTVDIDLGMNSWIRNEKLRLYRINAPELRGPERPEGLISRDFLRDKILGKEVLIETVKDKRGKYGRFLAEIWLKDESDNWININDLLVENGHAIYKEY